MKWTDALKEYAKQNGGKYVVPRKGTPEYEAVRKLMGGDAPKADAKAEAPKGDHSGTKKGEARKTARKAFEGLKEEAKKEKPKRASKPKKSAKADGMEAMKALEADASGKKARGTRKVKTVDGVTGVVASKSANPEVLLNNATNVHEPIAPPAALGGDLADLKEKVAKVRKPRSLPRLVEPETVKSDTPFSFTDLKKRIYGN